MAILQEYVGPKAQNLAYLAIWIQCDLPVASTMIKICSYFAPSTEKSLIFTFLTLSIRPNS